MMPGQLFKRPFDQSFRMVLPVFLLTILMLMLTACGSGQPAATEPPPTLVEIGGANTPTVLEPGNALTPLPPATQAEIRTPEPTIEGALVPGGPGTLVASKTEDPDAGKPFDVLRLERSYGPHAPGVEPETLTIEIKGDGSITRGDQTGTVSQAVQDQLNAMLREMNFFGISGDFVGFSPIEGTDEYLYNITVTRGDVERSIQMRDSLLAQPFRDLITLLLDEGFRLG